MKLFISKWRVEDFRALSEKSTYDSQIAITTQELKYAKESLIQQIDQFIMSRGFVPDRFVRYSLIYTQEDILPDYKLINKLFNFVTEYEHLGEFGTKLIKDIKVQQNFQNLKRFFGIEKVEILKYLRQGRFLSPDSIETIVSSIQQKFQEDFSYLYSLPKDILQDGLLTEKEDYLRNLYSNILAEISSYSSQRGLRLFEPTSSEILNQYDQEKWEDERVKGYHVVFHLCQFLGFDPLFFEPLSKDIFLRGQWARHHFRDWIYRKTSNRVSDILLTDNSKHNTYEQFSEGFIVAVMNSIIEVISMRKDDISELDLRQALEKNMRKYLSNNGGTTPEGNSIGELVDEVWKIWTKKGQGDFASNLKELKDRRNAYFKSNNYAEFLKIEYDMDANSRFVKNAREFQVLLLSEEVSGATRDLYVTSKELEYMKRIVSGGSVQTSLTNFIFTFNVETSHFIQLEFMKWLEQKIWKI